MQNHAVERLFIENTVSLTNIEQLTNGYLLNCRAEGKSPKTISIYKMVLRNLCWYFRQNSFPVQPEKISAIHIRQFLWYLASETDRWGTSNPRTKQPASQATVLDYYRTLKTFFGWLEREQLMQNNPFVNLKTPKMHRKVIQALTATEVERMLDMCSGKTALDVRNKAILSMLLDTGLRVAELSSLTLDDVDMHTGSIIVRHGKGGKQRVVHIGSKAQKALWKYITLYRRSESKSLFINRASEPLDVAGVKILIKRLGERAKVSVSPHKLRHTFAISYLRAGGDVFSLQYLLGHSTLQMTQRYLQSLNADDAVNAHRKFSPLDNMGMK